MKFLIDLDGTLLNQTKPNLDAVQFMSELPQRKIDFCIMTNSIKSPTLINERLRDAGIKVAVECIMNPLTAINVFLEKKHVKNAWIIGSDHEIEQAKIRNNDQNPEYVVLLDFEKCNTTYDQLQRIFCLIQKGIPVIAASGSHFYLKNEIKYLDTGSFVSLFEIISGIKIPVLGKPSTDYFNAGLNVLNADSREVTVIGDDWSTDILGAIHAGCDSILLQSGKYQSGDELKCKPSRVVSNLMDIVLS